MAAPLPSHSPQPRGSAWAQCSGAGAGWSWCPRRAACGLGTRALCPDAAFQPDAAFVGGLRTGCCRKWAWVEPALSWAVTQTASRSPRVTVSSRASRRAGRALRAGSGDGPAPSGAAAAFPHSALPGAQHHCGVQGWRAPCARGRWGLGAGSGTLPAAQLRAPGPCPPSGCTGDRGEDVGVGAGKDCWGGEVQAGG